MIRTVLKIEGMMCGMCEAHICDAIRKTVPSARKISASRGRKEAAFLTEDAVDAKVIKDAIDATGYRKPAIIINVEGDEWEETINRSPFRTTCLLRTFSCFVL